MPFFRCKKLIRMEGTRIQGTATREIQTYLFKFPSYCKPICICTIYKHFDGSEIRQNKRGVSAFVETPPIASVYKIKHTTPPF